MSEKIDLANVGVVANLPNYFRPYNGDPLPDGLIGATIVAVGAISEPQLVSGGGLVIDYRKPNETIIRRVVLAFNDVAMWVAAQSSLVPIATTD